MGGGHEGDVVVPTRSGPAFEVVQDQAVLELAIVVLNAPAGLGQTDQNDDRGIAGRLDSQ
ncbi:hypothetical protein GCM10010377_70780 [Streptomyces viridiviolaceus]|nr:hypothetical protein GCM10010377_70780 [Streptomyces viridiviolaceus]